MTWIPSNNSYVGNWFYEEKTVTKRAHFTSNTRENVTAPSVRECFASENVNSAFYQGWWSETLTDGSTVQYKFCANLDTNRLSGVYTFSRNNRSGNIMGQLVDNGRVFSGIWYENSVSATSIGQLMFSMNDYTKSFFGVWWNGLNAFFTTSTNVDRTFVAVRTSSEQPLVGDCMFERDVSTKYAQRWTGYFQEDLPLTPGMSLVNLRGKVYATYSRQLDAGVPLDIAGIAVGTVSDDGMSVTGTWVEIGDVCAIVCIDTFCRLYQLPMTIMDNLFGDGILLVTITNSTVPGVTILVLPMVVFGMKLVSPNSLLPMMPTS